jgi:cell division protein FtsQ
MRLRRADLSDQRDQTYAEVRPPMYTDTPPAVILRGNVGTPVAQRLGKTNVRRKYSVPMGNSGAELVIPGLPQVKFGWRLLSGLIFATMIFMLFSLSASDNFRINQAMITGNNRISSGDINLILDVADLPVFMIDINTVKNTLAVAYPELSNIEVNIALPNQLNISVIERAPVVAWQMENQTLWIDADGVVFQTRGDMVPEVVIQSQSLPPMLTEVQKQTDTAAQLLPSQLVEQNNFVKEVYVHVLDRPLLEAAKLLQEQLPAGTSIVYTQDHGLGWQAEEGWQAFVGFDLSNIEAKMAMYNSIVANLNAQNIAPGMISIEYIHAPFYRMERN